MLDMPVVCGYVICVLLCMKQMFAERHKFIIQINQASVSEYDNELSVSSRCVALRSLWIGQGAARREQVSGPVLQAKKSKETHHTTIRRTTRRSVQTRHIWHFHVWWSTHTSMKCIHLPPHPLRIFARALY